MPKYEKWLGASFGWALTGNPIGGLLGFIAGSFIEKGNKADANKALEGLTEFETNLIVLASHLIKIDGVVSLEEIAFTRNFLDAHFDERLSDKRTQVFNHCLQKEYDLSAVCDQLRNYTQHATRVQVVRFLFDLAMSDGELNERENYFIFRIAGYLTVNDVEFKKIKAEHLEQSISVYEILGVSKETSLTEIRNTYRKLVLKYHPDRNNHLSEAERKKLALKFQQLKEAYEVIKMQHRS
jgi:DnaJ like chaperone protein